MDNLTSKCISCGKGDFFFKRLCQQCYLNKHPILKQKKDLEITICERCELLNIRGHWSNFYASDIENSSIKPTFSTLLFQDWIFYYRPKEIKIREIKIVSDEEGLISGITGLVDIRASPDAFVPLMIITEDFMININWGECSECRTRLTGSYSSKIQIRSPKEVNIEQLENWNEEINSISESYPQTDGKNPLFKVNFLKLGLDALFQTKSAANSVGRLFAKKHGGIIRVTTEFSGFDKHKSKEYPRKPVVLIVLPEFDPGNIVIYDEQPIQILGYTDKVEFWNYQKKTKEKLPVKSFLDSKPELLDKVFQQFQLVNLEQEGTIAHIMNIKTFDTHYIDSSDIATVSEGNTFEGILYNGQLLRNQKKD